MTFFRFSHLSFCTLMFFLLTLTTSQAASPVAQWGQYPSRNMVSDAKGLPAQVDPATGQNILWTAALGTDTYSSPVVAGSRVLIGTNNNRPRDPKHKGDRGVLMCLDTATGQLTWQLVVPKMIQDIFLDWSNVGMTSPATVEGDRVYMFTNRSEVVCLDLNGMANGNDGPYRDEAKHLVLPGKPALEPGPLDADILWVFDMMAGAGTHTHDSPCASILIDGPILYLNTANGVDKTHFGINQPDAPALVALDKQTGRLVARDAEGIGHRTIHNNWSAPVLGTVAGRPLLVFGGGDGICYAFEPLKALPPEGPVQTLQNVWRFDCDPSGPKEDIYKWQDNRKEGPSTIIGTAVFDAGRVYVAAGGDFWHGKPKTWLKCIDASKTGDVTKSAEVWSYEIPDYCMSTPSVWNGLVFLAAADKKVHCLDAKSGQPLWTHDAEGEIWGSTLVADGKVYVGTQKGDLWTLSAAREPKVLGKAHLDAPINTTPTASDGVVYVATMRTLYALKEGAALKKVEMETEKRDGVDGGKSAQ
ncbi:MAG TPA: PQQ-binding-like beta-propeller repeat protein [Candidatus Sumerlaeota bacterium]|nr:PQQ-binding-like beta-propeller repeat protein [Candidatus Sumerlaeota bacterium]